MPSVAASERGRAQTMAAQEPAGAVVMGLYGMLGECSSVLASGSTDSRTLLERVARAGESPVGDVCLTGVQR